MLNSSAKMTLKLYSYLKGSILTIWPEMGFAGPFGRKPAKTKQTQECNK